MKKIEITIKNEAINTVIRKLCANQTSLKVIEENNSVKTSFITDIPDDNDDKILNVINVCFNRLFGEIDIKIEDTDQTIESFSISDILFITLLSFDTSNYTTNIKRLCKSCNLAINESNNTPFFDNNSHEKLIIINKNVIKKYNFYNNYYKSYNNLLQLSFNIFFLNENYDLMRDNCNDTKRDSIQKFDFNDLQDTCSLYHDFHNYDIIADPKLLFGITSNLVNVQAGVKTIKDILKNDKYDEASRKNLDFIIRLCKDNNYKPQSCDNFCPHASTCNHATNMIFTAKTPRNEIVTLKQPEYISLTDAENQLQDEFEKALNSNDMDIHVIKCQTGLGKTKTYIDSLSKKELNALLVVPTHKLQSEISNRFSDNGINCITSPNIADIDFEEKREIQRYYDIGAYQTASIRLHDIAKYNIDIKTYLEQNKNLYNSNDMTIITHDKLLISREIPHNTVIIDEDPLSSLLKISNLSLDDLEWLNFATQTNIDDPNIKSNIKTIFEFVSSTPVNQIETIPTLVYSNTSKVDAKLAQVLCEKVHGNIFDFLNCDYFVKTLEYNAKTHQKDKIVISFINKTDLPKDKKIIILSATIDETIYKQLYGNRIKFHEIGITKGVGNIIQYPEKSCSRYSMKKDDKLINRIKDKIEPDTQTITFKSISDKFGNSTFHFGNTEGIDELKGQNIPLMSR